MGLRCCSCAGVLTAADSAALQVVQGPGWLAQSQYLALHRAQQLLPVQGAFNLRSHTSNDTRACACAAVCQECFTNSTTLQPLVAGTVCCWCWHGSQYSTVQHRTAGVHKAAALRITP